MVIFFVVWVLEYRMVVGIGWFLFCKDVYIIMLLRNVLLYGEVSWNR